MEKSGEKKIAPESVSARLKRMAKVMNTALRTDVQADGTVVPLERPTILRTPAAYASGEIAAPDQEGERIELPAQRVVSISDLADHTVTPMGRPNEEVLSPDPLNVKEPSSGRGERRGPQDEVVDITTSAGEPSPRPAMSPPSSCARTSPYMGRKEPSKRPREDTRAEKTHKKKKATGQLETGTSSRRSNTHASEGERRSEYTTFELPLYTPQALEGDFFDFTTKALSLGLHDESSRLTQAAILATHSTHAIFRAVKDETEMLVNKKKYQVLLQAHEARAKEVEEKLAKADGLQAEMQDQINRYESVKAALDDQTLELDMERSLKIVATEQCADANKKLAELEAKTTAEREKNQANVVALIKELEEARAGAKNLEGEMEAAKAKAVEEFKAGAALKDMELKWKMEAYYEGVDTNFQLLTHYGALDLPKFLAASEDPTAQANDPKETYAEQWGHLVPSVGNEGQNNGGEATV